MSAARARLPAFLRFAAAGVLSMGIILGALTLFTAAGLHPSAAYALALALAFAVNFLVNRHFVFASGGAAHGGVARQATTYLASSLATRGAEWAAFSLLTAAVPIPPALAAILVQGVSMVVKFHVFQRFVFARKRAG